MAREERIDQEQKRGALSLHLCPVHISESQYATEAVTSIYQTL